MDPIAGALITGEAKRLIDQAKDLIGALFLKSRERARERGRQNAGLYVDCLAEELRSLPPADQLPDADHPAVTVTLEQSLLTAAQIEDETKRSVLAKLIRQRLLAGPESTLAMAIGLANERLTFITPRQLDLLGLIVLAHYAKPDVEVATDHDFESWFEVSFAPYLDTPVLDSDLKHLEAVGCVGIEGLGGRSLISAFRRKQPGYEEPMIRATKAGQRLMQLWETSHLPKVTLTSTGLVIASMVHEARTGIRTDMSTLDG